MTMQIFRYETETDKLRDLLSVANVSIVFLAGPTVRGNQQHLTSWRFAAIEEFTKQKFNGILIIPEFVSKSESDKGRRELPLWEFTGLSLSDAIMFWVPRTRELIGLTTNHEIGYWMARNRNKVVYGRPNDAYRIDYLDIMWEIDAEDRASPFINELPIYTTLEDTVKKSIEIANQNFKIGYPFKG